VFICVRYNGILGTENPCTGYGRERFVYFIETHLEFFFFEQIHLKAMLLL